MAQQQNRPRLADRMAGIKPGDPEELMPDPDPNDLHTEDLPTSQEAADDPEGTLERLEELGAVDQQSPEQRARAAATASSDPRDAARLLAKEGDAHKVNPDLNPGAAMSIVNEALTTNASALETDAQTGSLALRMHDLMANGDEAAVGLLTALQWAMNKLMHPSEQMDFCEQHGKVPITHMCSIHRNNEYAHALKMLNGGVEPEQ